MTLLEWLEQPIPRMPDRTVKSWLAELIYINRGKFLVTDWGDAAPGGPYGRMGLTKEEALDLIHLNGIWTGLTMADPSQEEEATRLVQVEMATHRQGIHANQN